jgi:hypothetical protein
MQFGSIDNMMVDCKSESSACRVQVRACIPVTTLYEFKIFDIFKKSVTMQYGLGESGSPEGIQTGGQHWVWKSALLDVSKEGGLAGYTGSWITDTRMM